MAAEEDGATESDALEQQLLQRSLHQRVEAFGGFVEDQQLWIRLHRLDHADLLAHAAAVVAHGSLQDAVAEFERLHDAVPKKGRPTAQRAHVVQVLPTAHVVVDGEARWEVADATADRNRILDDVEAEHAGRSARWVEEAEKGPDRGALPGAVRTEEAEELALADLEVQGLQGLDLPVASVVLGERLRLNRKRGVGGHGVSVRL